MVIGKVDTKPFIFLHHNSEFSETIYGHNNRRLTSPSYRRISAKLKVLWTCPRCILSNAFDWKSNYTPSKTIAAVLNKKHKQQYCPHLQNSPLSRPGEFAPLVNREVVCFCLFFHRLGVKSKLRCISLCSIYGQLFILQHRKRPFNHAYRTGVSADFKLVCV